jgi:hypothetical protein
MHVRQNLLKMTKIINYENIKYTTFQVKIFIFTSLASNLHLKITLSFSIKKLACIVTY